MSQPPPKPNGIECSKCGCTDLRVEATRRRSGRIVRYRVCNNCGWRRVTTEVPGRLRPPK